MPSALMFPKPRPGALAKRDALEAREKFERSEDRRVRERSLGRCEVEIVGQGRCAKRALHIHHQISGWGRRSRGLSLLSSNKLHVCPDCHTEIHQHVLKPEGGKFLRVR